jgi:hypothetical protein
MDSVEDRSDQMNNSVEQFRNREILLNILRAGYDEPLNFAAISTITGHNTAILGAPGLPGITWGHNILQRATGNGTSSYNVANDFVFNEEDDPATYQALLAPLDPSTIAAFYNGLGYPEDYLLLLFIHHFRVADKFGNIIGEYYSGRARSNGGNGTDPNPDLLAYALLASDGITFRVARGSPPGGSKKPNSQICFDPTLQGAGQALKNNLEKPGHPITWTALGGTIPSNSPPLSQSDMSNSASLCSESKTWISSEGSVAGTTTNIACVGASCGSQVKSQLVNKASYVVYDASEKVWIELFTRTTFGIYKFLGTLAADQLAGTLHPLTIPGRDPPSDGDELFVVESGASKNCFVSVTFKQPVCVPDQGSYSITKMSFSILHQLSALETTSINTTANSSTVRITP